MKKRKVDKARKVYTEPGSCFCSLIKSSDRHGLSISCQSDSQSFSKFTARQSVGSLLDPSVSSLLIQPFLALVAKLQELV